MSAIFSQAQEKMREYKGLNLDFLKSRWLKKLNLKQGEFRIESYQRARNMLSISQPELFGMQTETNVYGNEVFDGKIIKFADDKKLKQSYGCGSVGYLEDSEKRKVVEMHLGGFLAATPELFEDFGKEVLGLSTEK